MLTNARCLSEVDVPALDAVIFFHPRKSRVDIVQAIGRVMRQFEGKDLGYVILPIVVAPGHSAEEALANNEKYKTIWEILNALRSHDENLDNTINRMALGEDTSDKIEICGELGAVTQVVEDVNNRTQNNNDDETNENEGVLGDDAETDTPPQSTQETQLSFTFDDLSTIIKAKIVEKCGTRRSTWAKNIGEIAKSHISRIEGVLKDKGTMKENYLMNF